MKTTLKRSILVHTAAAVALAIASPGAAHAQLRVGAARIDITPPLYPGWQRPTGKFDNEHLYARAILVDNGKTRTAILGVDQGGLANEVWDDASKRISAELDVPVDHVLMSATHTHSGGLPIGGVPADVMAANNQRVADAFVKAVDEAKDKLQPAVMVFGTGKAYLNVNRDAINPDTHLWTQAPNLDGPSDKTVAVLAFDTPQGTPIAVYVNYAMHPINIYLSNFTSADFAGAMSNYLEKNYAGSTVIFSQGASGDQNPLYLHASTDGMASRYGAKITGNDMMREPVEEPLRDGNVESRPMDPTVRERLETWMNAEGEVLGEEVIRVLSNAKPEEGNVRIWGKQTEVSCPGRTRTDKGREGMTGAYVDGPAVPLRLGVIGIGDVALTHIDAEVYTMIGQRLKQQSPLMKTVFVTLANGRAPSGYIPDDRSYGHKTFQVLGARIKQGCAEQTIINTLDGMIAEYDRQKP